MGAFDKLKEIKPKTAPVQAIVPIKERRRDQETSYNFWLDKQLMKDLKVKALERETSVKQILEELIRGYLGK